MSFPIKYLSLQKPELEYEISIRGYIPEATVQDLRRQIIKMSTDIPSEDILESPYTPQEDLKAVNDSLTKAHANIVTLKTKYEKNLYLRTETLMNHLYHRLNRINPTDDLTDLYNNTNSHFKALLKDLLKIKPHTSEITTKQDNTVVSVTCERNLISEISKIKYSGKTCVRAFIQKVEEFVITRGITYDKLLSFVYEIFTDGALHWYRSIKDDITSWSELVELLKQDFSTPDYDYRLLTEIRSRTQGENENINIYLSVMQGMFSRLDKPITDENKLEILLHNIRPAYASTLASANDITTLDQLKQLCKNYENIQSRLTQFREPPKVNSDTIAPEFAYNKPNSSSNFSNTNQTKNFQYNQNRHQYFNHKKNYNYTKPPLHNLTNSTQATSNTNNKPITAINLTNNYSNKPKKFCPRCRTNSHTLDQCRSARYPICFKCGTKDFTYPNCPKCQSKLTTSKN